MGLAHFLYPTLVQRIAEAIPIGAGRPGCWNARRAFLGVMGLVRAESRMSIKTMLERQFELDQFPDFSSCPSASGFSQGRRLLRKQDFQAAWGLAKGLVDAAVVAGRQRWIALDGS